MKKILLTLIVIACVFNTAYGASAYNTDYERVPPSQSLQVLGPVGATGDVLERVVVTVMEAATAGVLIQDGATAAGISVIPASSAIGAYSVELGLRSVNGAWRVSTGAGASVIAIGSFK